MAVFLKKHLLPASKVVQHFWKFSFNKWKWRFYATSDAKCIPWDKGGLTVSAIGALPRALSQEGAVPPIKVSVMTDALRWHSPDALVFQIQRLTVLLGEDGGGLRWFPWMHKKGIPSLLDLSLSTALCAVLCAGPLIDSTESTILQTPSTPPPPLNNSAAPPLNNSVRVVNPPLLW